MFTSLRKSFGMSSFRKLALQAWASTSTSAFRRSGLSRFCSVPEAFIRKAVGSDTFRSLKFMFFMLPRTTPSIFSCWFGHFCRKPAGMSCMKRIRSCLPSEACTVPFNVPGLRSENASSDISKSPPIVDSEVSMRPSFNVTLPAVCTPLLSSPACMASCPDTFFTSRPLFSLNASFFRLAASCGLPAAGLSL